MIIKFLKTDFCFLLIISLLVLGDTLTGLSFLKDFNISWTLKANISIILALFLFLSNKKLFYRILILFSIILAGMVFNYLEDFVFKISLFFEYISGILFFNFLIFHKRKTVNKTLLFIFLFYTASIFAAALFDIGYLKTYGENRFGYKPIFSSQNEFSYVMISIVAYFYKNYLNKNSTFNLILIIFSIAASILLGTKVVYIFIFMFFNFLGLKHLRLKYYLFLFTSFIVSAYYLRDNIYSFISKYFSALTKVYYKTGFWDAISSLRLSLLKDRIDCQISNFEFINYFFGGIYKYCITEMSIIDIYLSFGLIGFWFYFYLYKKEVLDKLKLDTFGKFLIFSVIILTFLSGYLFENLSSQYYILMFLYISYYDDRYHLQNTKLKE